MSCYYNMTSTILPVDSLEEDEAELEAASFIYFLISRRATLSGLYLCGFFTPLLSVLKIDKGKLELVCQIK